jgi:hypothetical protein
MHIQIKLGWLKPVHRSKYFSQISFTTTFHFCFPRGCRNKTTYAFLPLPSWVRRIQQSCKFSPRKMPRENTAQVTFKQLYPVNYSDLKHVFIWHQHLPKYWPFLLNHPVYHTSIVQKSEVSKVAKLASNYGAYTKLEAMYNVLLRSKAARL